MLLSQILAWISAVLCIAAVLRYPARVSRVAALNRGFHKIHIPAGILLLASAALHGIFAGNPPDTPVAAAEPAAVLFTVNWGSGCFLCAALLAASYLPHKKLKKWLVVHRVLAVLMAALLVLHLVDVGIHLPDRWTSPSQARNPASSAPPESQTAAPAALPTVAASPRPAPTASAAPTAAPTPSAEPTAAPTEEPTPEPGLADGVYTGSAQGRNGPITVNVSISAGKIAGIEITGHSETPKYFSLAEGVVDSILSAQSPQVDAVTGATLSSEGIKAAVTDALKQLEQ